MNYASDTANIQFLADFYTDRNDEVRNVHANATAWTSRLREHEESFEEQELRRRRREAVVFNEGGPVRQDDIIQRNDVGSPVVRRGNELEMRGVEALLRQITAGSDGLEIDTMT